MFSTSETSQRLGQETPAPETTERLEAMALEIEQLRRAIETRDIIGQAKGMLMERMGLDAAGAFNVLSKISQDTNIPVAQLTQRLVAGTLSDARRRKRVRPKVGSST
jgi:AmiR/NasT family two-component response regulator